MEDYKDYRYQCSAVSKEINAAKSLCYSNRVEECHNDSKLLHKITSIVLVNQHQITLPSTENDEELANNFGAYVTFFLAGGGMHYKHVPYELPRISTFLLIHCAYWTFKIVKLIVVVVELPVVILDFSN